MYYYLEFAAVLDSDIFRTWKKLPKHDGFIASISLNDAINSSNNNVDFKRWSVHGDWVQQASKTASVVSRRTNNLYVGKVLE